MAEVPYGARVISSGQTSIGTASTGTLASGLTRGSQESILITVAPIGGGISPTAVLTLMVGTKIASSYTYPPTPGFPDFTADYLSVYTIWTGSGTFNLVFERTGTTNGSLTLDWQVHGVV